jgi:hypothetical protein
MAPCLSLPCSNTSAKWEVVVSSSAYANRLMGNDNAVVLGSDPEPKQRNMGDGEMVVIERHVIMDESTLQERCPIQAAPPA